MAAAITELRVYPQQPTRTLVTWEINPDLDTSGAGYALQMSRSGNHADTDWITVATGSFPTGYVLIDANQRAWSNDSLWHYRLQVTAGDGSVYNSEIQSSLGTLNHTDRLTAKELFRQAVVKLTKTHAGRPGFLYRRKWWGERATTVDPDTDTLVIDNAAEDYGTGFVGGYWTPIRYCVEFNVPISRTTNPTLRGTTVDTITTEVGLAYPMPRSGDLWLDCATGDYFDITQVSVLSAIRHFPITVSLTFDKSTPTNLHPPRPE